MSMFLRSEKTTDSRADGAAPPREKIESPLAGAAEKKPVQSSLTSSPASSQTRVLSVIGKTLKITGQLECTEDIQVDGEVDGDVRGALVKVGSSAKIKGNVYGEEVELAGTIDGKIEARKVVLTSTAHMSGDIIHQEIRIDSGAFMDGYCRPEFGKPRNTNISAAPKVVAAAREPNASPNAKDGGPKQFF